MKQKFQEGSIHDCSFQNDTIQNGTIQDNSIKENSIKEKTIFLHVKPDLQNHDDIIFQQWPKPSVFRKMPLIDRAKIFLPFAALKGFEEAIIKTYKASILGEDIVYNVSRETQDFDF